MRKFLLLFFCCLIVQSTFAQRKTITGSVRDKENNESLAGVSIIEKHTTNGTITNADGKFSISVGANSTITVSFIGMKPQEFKVSSIGSSLQVALEPSNSTVDEVVVVGYGTQKKADLTGAVATVDVAKSLEARPITDVGRALQGTTPGLTIRTSTGDLGVDPKITIRGLTGSFNASNGAQPLILLDNVEIKSLQLVNPDDIASISVLKDAASSSIYGTKAAFGVVLITTKSGQRGGGNHVSYTSNFSWSTPTTTPKIASAADGAQMAFSALQRENPSTSSFGVIGMYVDQTAIQKMKDWQTQYGNQKLSDEMVMGRDFEIRGGKLYFYRPWDAGKANMKTWTPQENHNITIDGGNDKTTYDIGLGYLDQNGVLKVNPDSYKRYNVSAGINTTVKPWLDLRAKGTMARSDLSSPHNYGSATYDAWYYLYRWPVTYPYGTYQGKPFRSAVTENQQANEVTTSTDLDRFSVGGTLKPIEGLTVDADYTYTASNSHNHDAGGTVSGWNFWSGDLSYGPYTSAKNNMVSYLSSWYYTSTLKAYATYVKKIGVHSFKFMAGMDAESYSNWTQGSTMLTLMDQSLPEIKLATGTMTVSGTRGHSTTEGYFGRINYSYKDRYLLEVNGRYDGSSSFPINKHWGFFPSMSAGWRITEEPFMEAVKPVLSTLKLRGSWGSIGNQDVGSQTFLPLMTTYTTDWLMGTTFPPSVNTPRIASPTLTWETISTLDGGLDARFFNDKLGVTFDWYQRTTSDMLSSGVTVPSSFGATPSQRNYGELRGRGWELQIDWNHSFENNLNIYVTANLSDGTEKLTKYANSVHSINGNYQGKTIGEIWGYETDRLFQQSDFTTDASGKQVLKAGIPSQSLYESGWFTYGPGDVKYKDLNHNGVIDYGTNTVENPGDQKVIGNSTPRYLYGFRFGADWKGFDFDIFFQGVGKRDYWANGPLFIPGYRPGEAWYQHQLDYWTPQNTSAFYPRPTDASESNSSRNFLCQSKYLINLAYLRCKSLQFGYTLPKSLTTKASIQKARIYFSGENLFEKDHLKLPIDPEVDYTTAGLNDPNTFGRVYPYRRTVSFGLQIYF